MIKKLTIAAVFALGSALPMSQAQIKIDLPTKKDNSVSPIVREKIENYAREVNRIIQDEKRLMEKDLELAKTEAERKGWSKAEIDDEKAKIADRYSQRIDRRIADLGFDVDDVIRKQVRYSLLNSDAADQEQLKKELTKKFRAENSFRSYISYGVMTFTNDATENDLDRNKTFSNNLELGLHYNRQLGAASPWGIVSGVGLSWRTLRLGNDMFFKTENNGVSIENAGKNLSKSKLRTGYVMVPLGVQYNFSPLQTVADDVVYRSYFKGFRVGGGLYGGVQMSTNHIIKGDDMKIRNRAEYKVNPFVYGAEFKLSYNQVTLFVKKDFSPYFKDNAFPNDKMVQIGLSYGY